MPAISHLSVETVQHIASYARADDIRGRTESGTDSRSSSGGNPLPAPAVEGKASWARGHARRQSEFWRADSALSLLKTCSWIHEAVLPVVWRALDFTEILGETRDHAIQLLATSHGKHVRQLQLKVALAPVYLNTDGSPTPTTAIVDATALSIAEAVGILSSVPSLSWLEIELLSLHEGAYISKLPIALEQAILLHSRRLKHFGISAEGTSALTGLQFQMDERMVADLVSNFTILESLTLHRIGQDLLLQNSPLFNAISTLRRLRKLYVLEVPIEHWTNGAVNGELRELTLVSCPKLSPASLDKLLEHHQYSLRTLALVNPLPIAEGSSSSYPTVKYRLPALRTLHIEADNEVIDTIAYLERFASTGLSHLILKYAPGISTEELEQFVMGKKLKLLQRLELGEYAMPDADRERLQKLAERLERQAGVEVIVGEKSSLVVQE